MNYVFWILLAVTCLILLFVIVLSGMQLARTLLSVSKCPDCGRIMQHVLYSGMKDTDAPKQQLECPFCQAKHIRPIQRGKKLTMYP